MQIHYLNNIFTHKISFHHTCIVLAFFWLALFTKGVMATESQKSILMVLSSHGVNNGEEKPGFEFDELSKAYLTFTDNSVVVDLASPSGGAIQADKYNPNKEYNRTFLDDKTAMAKLGNTLKIADIDFEHYDGIFIVGGKGAMFDLPKDKHLQTTIANIYQAGGTVGAVCHGPAALVNVKLKSGEYLVSGKKVNGFTNIEESVFGKKWVNHFEFLLEDKLKERNALFQQSPMMLSHVAIDGRLITGQNPSSTVDSAKAMLKIMGISPIDAHHYKDDLTLKLVAKVISGDQSGITEYRANKAKYQTELVGMYGFYAFGVAKTEKEIKSALTLMALAQEDMQHPTLGLQIAMAHQKLGHIEIAKNIASALVAADPHFEEAKNFINSL